MHLAQSAGDKTGRAAQAHPDVLADRENESSLQAPEGGGRNPDDLRHACTTNAEPERHSLVDCQVSNSNNSLRKFQS